MIEQDSMGSQFEVELEDPSPVETAGPESSDSLIESLTQLLQRKRLIAKVTGISILIGLILFIVLPAHYKADIKIMPPKQSQSTTSILNPSMGFGALAEAGGLLADPNAIYMGLLKSRPVADALIHQFGLLKVYHAKDMTAARKKLEDNTKIVSDPSTLIVITVTDTDKTRAAQLANAYADQLRGITKSLSFTEATQRRLFFEEQVNKQKEALIAAEVAFQQVQQNKGLVRLDAQTAAIISNLSILRSQIAAKEVALQALRSFSTEHNPELQLVEGEIATMQEEAAQMEKTSRPTGYSDMGLKDVPKAGLEYIRASRELQYQQSLFDILLRQFEAAKLDEAKEAAVIQVAEPAIVPDRRTSPRLAVILPLSTILGLLLGIFVAIIMRRIEIEQADQNGAASLHRLRKSIRW